MKKFVRVLLSFVFVLSVCFSFCGCSLSPVSIFVATPPKKTIYSLNEEIDLSGLKIQGIKSDGTNKKMSFSQDNISNQVDMTSFGKKQVIITIDGLSTSFDIYIPNVVATNQDNLKEIISTCQDGFVVYLKGGDYFANNNQDIKYNNIVVNKSLTIIGEKGKTFFGGNFLVGVEKQQDNYTKIPDFKNVEFLNIDFKINSKTTNGIIEYSNPIDYKNYGAINGYDTKNMTIKNCSFSGYTFGILCENSNELSVINCVFSNIRLCAINITTNAKNLSICKNIFMDIGTNTIYFVDDKQFFIGAIKLSFNQEKNLGVIIANNTFTRIALKTNSNIYLDEQSKELSTNNKTDDGYYINNSAIIILRSSDKQNLQVSGIILSFNSYGNTLNNMLFGTTATDFINHNAVIINNN